MTWQTYLFLIVAGIAFGYSGWKFRTLFLLMKRHQGKAPVFKDIPARVYSVLLNVFGQRAVMKKNPIGIAHATIFWGFLFITIGTLEQFLSTLHVGWDFSFLGPYLYPALIALQDFFTFSILIAVAYAFYRRWIVRPAHLGRSVDAEIILVFTGALMISIILMNVFHILAVDPWFKSGFVFSNFCVSPFEGISRETAQLNYLIFKWIHMLLVLAFAMYIPNSKHLHIVAAGPNTALKKLEIEKPMTPINFEDESKTQFGAGKVTDLSWKDALDYYSCTECGRCEEVCPAWNTGKPLSPKRLIMDLKSNLYRNKENVLAGKYEEVTPLIDDHITEDVIWACTSCRACEQVCPVFIQHTDKIYESRRNLVMMEGKFPTEVQTVFKNMETNASPWAFAASDRANWAEGLDVKTMSEQPHPEYLLWVGCAGSFDDRNKKVLRAFVNILKKCEVQFSILGTEEKCTGDPARRIGNEYLFQTLAHENIETLNRYQVKKILTACPHCFNTIKNEYKDFGGNYEVIHHSQFISEMIRTGKIKPTKSLDAKITFHDSCYLGRWNGIYAEPREAIDAIPGLQRVEMKSHHEKSMCCGAGGGRMWMEERIGKGINIARTEQAIDTEASLVATACPFCMTMITDGVKTKEKAEAIQVMDIAELVEQSL